MLDSMLQVENMYISVILETLYFRNQSWYVKDINISKLNFLAKLIKGDHNFLSYSKYNSQLKTQIVKSMTAGG